MTNADEQLSRAKTLRQQGNHEEALQIARQVTRQFPENADAWWVLGLAAHSLKRYSDSLSALREMIKLAPRWAPGWAQYGLVLEENGQKDESKRAHYQALKFKPDHVFSHRQLARIFTDEKNPDSALTHLRAIDESGQGDGHILNTIGNLCLDKGHYSEAISYYLRSASELFDPAPYFNLSLVYTNPEISQDVDAVDCLKRALAIRSDYEPALKKLPNITPRLLKLAQECAKYGETFLSASEWFQFYVSPFELLGYEGDIDDFDVKTLQRLKKRLLQEIDLEDGKVEALGGVVIDKSRVIRLCDELLDEEKKGYHWQVYQDPYLHWFLSRGDFRLFQYSEDYFPEDTLESLDESAFREWLSEPFAKQFNIVISRALEKGALPVVEALFDGRRWTTTIHEGICFSGVHRYVDRLLEPLRQIAKNAQDTKPSVESIKSLLMGVNAAIGRANAPGIVSLLNLLPQPFRDQQSEAVRLIRSIAIDCFNHHGEADLSKAVLDLSRQFAFKSADLRQRLDEDFKQIQKLIAEERKHEAKLTLSDKPMEVTKDGVRQGDKFVPTASITSVRWGIVVTGYQYAPVHEFLMAFRDDARSEIQFSWRSSNGAEQSKLFHSLVEAVLHYVLPHILVKMQLRLTKGERVQIGPCTVSQHGVSFETRGWFTNKQNQLSWNQIGTEVENGSLIIYNRSEPKTRTSLPLKETENAIVLRFLADTSNS